MVFYKNPGCSRRRSGLKHESRSISWTTATPFSDASCIKKKVLKFENSAATCLNIEVTTESSVVKEEKKKKNNLGEVVGLLTKLVRKLLQLSR